MIEKKLDHHFSELGFKFNNPALLKKALTHRSYLNEQRKTLESNERLEYLGDAVLELVVSEFLYKKYPSQPEGVLTNFRSKIVQTKTLSYVASLIKLGNFLQLSKGEAVSGGSQNRSILADTLEAVIGAIYLDKGYQQAQKFIKKFLLKNFRNLVKQAGVSDYKSLLQEKVQANNGNFPIYKLIKAQGPDHNKVFTIAVYCFGKKITFGSGRSKQEAQQDSAKKALEKLGYLQ